MGVVPFNVRTYEGNAITLEQKFVHSLQYTFCLLPCSYVLAPHSYLIVATSVRKWSNTHTHTHTD